MRRTQAFATQRQLQYDFAMTWVEGTAFRRALLGALGVGSLVAAATTASCASHGGNEGPRGGSRDVPMNGAGGDDDGGQPTNRDEIDCKNRAAGGADI